MAQNYFPKESGFSFKIFFSKRLQCLHNFSFFLIFSLNSCRLYCPIIFFPSFRLLDIHNFLLRTQNYYHISTMELFIVYMSSQLIYSNHINIFLIKIVRIYIQYFIDPSAPFNFNFNCAFIDNGGLDYFANYQFYISKLIISFLQTRSFMLDRLTNKNLGIIGVASTLLASVFLAPEKVMIPAACSVLGIAGSIVFAQSRWVTSKADEWLLVIRDGKLLKSGVGMKTFVGFADTIVRFPSKIEQVTFTANNVTQQMQGVQITGFAFWSVYRQDDGPFRCYKYMEGNDANANVQALCESVLRALIANSSLEDVLRNRTHLRDSIKEELKDQFKGWGVWLQTVEITEVKISSNRLFTDLQAQFRQATRLKAQRIELSSSEKISEVRQNTNMKINELVEDVRTKQQITKNTENLRRKELQENFETKMNELEKKRMEREKKIELETYKNNFATQQEKQKNTQETQKIEQQFRNKQQVKDFQLYKLHTPLTLQKYEIDSMVRIFESQGLRNVSINQFSSKDKESIGAILPLLGYGAAQLRSGA